MYSFPDHLHNYAVWTAARAVQRSFTSTKVIKAAIGNSGLRTFSESEAPCSTEDFEKLHRKWAAELMENFTQQGIQGATYGRAAKIISIYLKTAVVLPNKATCLRSRVIHPPIDNILLTCMSQANDKLKAVAKEKWTQLSEGGYWNLINTIRDAGEPVNWQLETYWLPEREAVNGQKAAAASSPLRSVDR